VERTTSKKRIQRKFTEINGLNKRRMGNLILNTFGDYDFKRMIFTDDYKKQDKE